jgi:hypothetical protein
VLSLVSGVICPPVGLLLGIVAWVIGQGDLEKVRRREMSSEGEGSTNGGRICGILGTFVSLLLGMAWVVYLVMYWKH